MRLKPGFRRQNSITRMQLLSYNYLTQVFFAAYPLGWMRVFSHLGQHLDKMILNCTVSVRSWYILVLKDLQNKLESVLFAIN